MNKILATVMLVVIASASYAEPRTRQVRYMCGSLEDIQLTVEKYSEKLVVASLAPNKETVNLLYVNFETQTSSWIIQDLQTDEYCMVGVGDNLHVPKESPLNTGTGIGTKISY